MLLFYPPHLRGESGCKDKYFYIFPPNLSALFFKLFFGTAVEESFCRLHPQKMKNTSVKMFQNVRFVSESGCKGKDFFINSKLFKRNFWSFFSNPDQGNILKNSAQPKTLETNPSPPLTCAIGLTPHSLIAAANIEQFIPHLQIFYQLFLEKNEYFT